MATAESVAGSKSDTKRNSQTFQKSVSSAFFEYVPTTQTTNSPTNKTNYQKFNQVLIF